VTLGPIVDGLRVVRSGLKAGEPVVVNGLQRVRPGMPVEPVLEPAAANPAAAFVQSAAAARKAGRSDRNAPATH
jgi:multidrug efflux system membrane fusion protein